MHWSSLKKEGQFKCSTPFIHKMGSHIVKFKSRIQVWVSKEKTSISCLSYLALYKLLKKWTREELVWDWLFPRKSWKCFKDKSDSRVHGERVRLLDLKWASSYVITFRSNFSFMMVILRWTSTKMAKILIQSKKI